MASPDLPRDRPASLAGALRVLVVDDSEADFELIHRELARKFNRVVCERVETAAQLRAALATPWDGVICDGRLPTLSGLEAIGLVRARDLHLPVIFVSGTIGEAAAVQMLKAGANDYVMKSSLSRIAPALERALNDAKGFRLRKRTEAGLRRAQSMARLGHIITGAGGRFLEWSDNVPGLIRLAPEEMPGTTRAWMKLVVPGDRALFRERALQGVGSRGRVELEYGLTRGDGSVMQVRQVNEPFEDGRQLDEEARWFCTLQDTTEQHEEASRRRVAEKGVRRLNRIYAMLSGINALIVRVRDRDELFRETCRIAVEAGGFRMSWIGLYQGESNVLRPMAWQGHEDGFVSLIAREINGSGTAANAMMGRLATRLKRVVVVDDMEAAHAFPLRAEALERGFRSGAALPLVVGDRVIGLFGVFAGEAGIFDDAEQRLLNELAADIGFALSNIENLSRLEHLALHDPLTGLANRTLFLEHAAQACAIARDSGERAAVMTFDIDRFKNINDTLGRHAGDALLRQVAERLRTYASEKTTLARLGSDHFAVVVPDIGSDEDVARRIEQRIMEIFGAPFEVAATELGISGKLGAALFPADGGDADTLLGNAEAALKRAKRSGERYLFYSQDMTSRVAERLRMESRLRRAVARDEFVLHYQPKLHLSTGSIVGLEALIRWSTDGELVPPVRFIPLMEEIGLILDVGAWALRQAARDHQRLGELVHVAPRIAVNVSPIQLHKRDFVETVRQALESGANATGIDLEITESVAMQDVEGNIAKLSAVRELGVEIAIDDFGTGYSSLAYLARLPVQMLKIDRSFIVKMLADPNTMTLVSTMISLAHSLKLKVVAEGVDSQDQEKVLRLLRCDQVQGYLFGRPVPLDHIVAQIKDSRQQQEGS